MKLGLPKPSVTSLRHRLTLGVVGITSGVVAIAALFAWMSSAAIITTSHDQSLLNWTKRLRSDDGPSLVGRYLAQPPRVTSRWRNGPFSDQRLLFQITDAEGRELARSTNLPEGQGLADLFVDSDAAEPITRRLLDGHVVRGVAIRLAHIIADAPRTRSTPPPAPVGPAGTTSAATPPLSSPPLSPPPLSPPIAPEPLAIATPITVYFALDASRLHEELARNAWTLASMWLAATVLASGAVLLLGQAMLRPLERLGRALERLGPDDLAARIPEHSGPDEARIMVQRLNELLARLHDAFAREQATIAHIAHELRTPVAAVRADLEFRLMVASDSAERTVLTSCLATMAGMHTQITHLLQLARLEAGKEPLTRQHEDVATIIRERLARQAAAAHAHAMTVTTAVPERLVMATSAPHLEQLLDNLLGNAIAHGTHGGEVCLTLHHTATTLLVQLTNPCTVLPDPQSLGKTYYRADGARPGNGHTGLGLALCLRLARLLGGRLDLAVEGHVFTATLSLPTDAPEPDPCTPPPPSQTADSGKTTSPTPSPIAN